MDRLIADKIRQNPALLNRARVTLGRWMETSSPQAQPALLEWQTILSCSTEDILRVVEGNDSYATRLRQSSPFCGILTREERTRILLKYRLHESHPA